jgi:hypothetical protein
MVVEVWGSFMFRVTFGEVRSQLNGRLLDHATIVGISGGGRG